MIMEIMRKNACCARRGHHRDRPVSDNRQGRGDAAAGCLQLAEEQPYDEFDIAFQLSAERGWMVPAYTMPPNAQDVKMMRALVKVNLSRSLVDRLVDDLRDAVKTLETKGPVSPEERARQHEHQPLRAGDRKLIGPVPGARNRGRLAAPLTGQRRAPRSLHGGGERVDVIGAPVAPAVDEETGSTGDPAGIGGRDVVGNAIGVVAALHLLPEAIDVEAQLFRVSPEIGSGQLVLVREEPVVHVPEVSRARGLGRFRRNLAFGWTSLSGRCRQT